MFTTPTLIALLLVAVLAFGLIIVIRLGNTNRHLHNIQAKLYADKVQEPDVEELACVVLEAFQSEVAKIATQYASDYSLLNWLDELEERGDIDLSGLSDETQARVWALVIKRAEEAVVLAEDGLKNLRRKILKEQDRLAEYPGNSTFTSNLNKLKKQEEYEIAYRNKALEWLDEVVYMMGESYFGEEPSVSENPMNEFIDKIPD